MKVTEQRADPSAQLSLITGVCVAVSGSSDTAAAGKLTFVALGLFSVFST